MCSLLERRMQDYFYRTVSSERPQDVHLNSKSVGIPPNNKDCLIIHNTIFMSKVWIILYAYLTQVLKSSVSRNLNVRRKKIEVREEHSEFSRLFTSSYRNGLVIFAATIFHRCNVEKTGSDNLIIRFVTSSWVVVNIEFLEGPKNMFSGQGKK